MATVNVELDPGAAEFLTSTFPALSLNGTNFPVRGLAYDSAADEAAFWSLEASQYGSGNLTVELEWYADTASSGDVVWGACIAAITPDADTQDIETKALATEQTVTDSHLGTTGQRLHRASVTVSNLDSLAAKDFVALRVRRVGSNVADTMAGDAILVKVRVSYSDT
jgi:hypothetical protein